MRAVVASCLLLFVLVAGVTGQERLVVDPNQIVPLNDAAGKLWDVQSDGSINNGSNDCFDGAFDVIIANNFRLRYALARQMRGGAQPGGVWNKEGGDYVFGPVAVSSPNYQGVRLTRRIGLTPDKRWLRYVEVFENTGAKARKVSFDLSIDFGAKAGESFTTSGGKTFGKKDTGLGYIQSMGRPSLARLVGSPGAGGFSYTLRGDGGAGRETFGPYALGAKGRIAVVHFVAQLNSKEEVKKALKSASYRALCKGLPRDLLRSIVNIKLGPGGGALEVPRLSTSDLIVLRSGKRLLGELGDETLELRGLSGEHRFETRSLVGLKLVGGAGGSGGVLLGRRDRQVLSGVLSNSVVKFTLQNGQELAVTLDKIASIGLKVSPEELEGAEEESTEPRKLRLRSGDSLHVDALDEPLSLVTRYGTLAVPLELVDKLELEEEGNWGHRLRLRNGSSLGGLLVNPALKCRFSVRVGADDTDAVAVRRDMILRLGLANEPSYDTTAPGAFRVAMRNGDELVVKLVDEQLSLASEFGEVKFRVDDVRSIVFLGGERVEVKLWDGSQLDGRLLVASVMTDLDGLAVDLPQSLIVKMEQKSFKLPADLEAVVFGFIASLDSDDIEERDRAQYGLARLGPAVRSYVRRASAEKGASPEKSQRLQAVIGKLGVLDESVDLNVAELRKRLEDQRNDAKQRERAVLRSLKAIWRAQRLFQSEDRDKDGEDDFGTLAQLAEFVGKEGGIDGELGKGEKWGYSFSSGASSDPKARNFLWWAIAAPKDGKGRHYFMHSSGTVFVSDGAIEFDKASCDPPASTQRLEE
jgi:hypothetical protein